MKNAPAMPKLRFALIMLALGVLSACDQGAGHSAETAAVAPRYVLVARGRIDIEGGLLNLRFPIDGKITEVLVHPGDRVHPGQPLARLDDRQAVTEVDIAKAEVWTGESTMAWTARG